MYDTATSIQVVSYCGLYCGACKHYLLNVCLGCMSNEKSIACAVRACCITHNYPNCVHCQNVSNITQCKELQACLQTRACACTFFEKEEQQQFIF